LNHLVPRAQKLLSEFQEVQESSTQPTRQAVPLQRVTWSPPQPGRYKVNYDAAFFGDSNEVGIGVIIRNHNGEVMASLCHRIHYPHSVEAMEAYAARSAIQMAIDLGVQAIDIEGDSQTVVDALLNHAPCFTLYGNLINDTNIATQSCHFVQFLHVKRDGNSIAHSIAKRAKFSQPFEVWMESVPPDLVTIICTNFSIQ
jgi:ribonuclease HI